MGVQHVHHWVNPLGAQWRNQIQIGDESFLTTSFYQPLDVGTAHASSSPALSSNASWRTCTTTASGSRPTSSSTSAAASTSAGTRRGMRRLRLGYLFDQRKTRIDTGLEVFPQIDADDAGLDFSARYDSRDTPTFATKGLRRGGSLRAHRRIVRLRPRLGPPRSRRPKGHLDRQVRDLAQPRPAAPTSTASFRPIALFSLGGPRVLPAYQHDELRVSDYWIAESSFLRQLKVLSPIKNQAIYGGLGFQAVGL